MAARGSSSAGPVNGRATEGYPPGMTTSLLAGIVVIAAVVVMVFVLGELMGKRAPRDSDGRDGVAVENDAEEPAVVHEDDVQIPRPREHH